MGATNLALSNNIITDNTFTTRELAFIHSYLICGNAAQACREAGYKCKSDNAMARQGSDLLRQPKILGEIQAQIAQREDAKVAKASEILQFYTSVMRGQVLDQFGIEASLDTRIKAANELARHQIELPMKLEQKNVTNNIGSITLNFIPRNQENPSILPDFEEIVE